MKPNLGYRSVKLDGGWRKSWDAILSGRFSQSPGDALLFYDAAGGTGEFYTLDGAGNLRAAENEHRLEKQLVSDRARQLCIRSVHRSALLRASRWPRRVLLHGRPREPCAPPGSRRLADELGSHPADCRSKWPDWTALLRSRRRARRALRERWAGRDSVPTVVSRVAKDLEHHPPVADRQQHVPTVLRGVEWSCRAVCRRSDGSIEPRVVYSDWRMDWSVILPVDLQSSSYAGLVFYDRADGESELYTIAAAGESRMSGRSSGGDAPGR